MRFSEEEQQQLISLSRQTLEHCAWGKNLPILSKELAPALLVEDGSGVFVTLHLSGHLRGCIGLMESNLSLAATVKAMTKAASLDDPRFSPVQPDELERISLDISVLSPKREISDSKEIELGMDGIVISGRGRQGVFLPQVAIENNWDRHTFLSECCKHKAGLPSLAWQDKDVEIYAFRTEIIKES